MIPVFLKIAPVSSGASSHAGDGEAIQRALPRHPVQWKRGPGGVGVCPRSWECGSRSPTALPTPATSPISSVLASKSVSKLPPGASPGLRSLLSYANCCSEQLEIVPTEVWGCSSLHASLWNFSPGPGSGTGEGPRRASFGRTEWQQGSDRLAPRRQPAEPQACLALFAFFLGGSL